MKAIERNIRCTVRSERIAYKQPRGMLLSANDLPIGVPACEDPQDKRRCSLCKRRAPSKDTPHD